MDETLIKRWAWQMQRALIWYFTNHGVPNPDPGDVGCLTAIGVTEIDRRNLGFKPQSFFIMASLLVPALLNPNHILHAEITGAVAACKGQSGGAAMAMRAATTAPTKARGPLSEIATLGKAPKLPGLGSRAKAFATMLKAKAAPKRTEKRRPK